MTPRAPGRGFTLLEVLVAVAILGLGLTVILSSQVGLFSSSQRSANLALATNLARCRMSEVEVKLLKEGYPLADENDEGPCCEDETQKNFSCAWKIERIQLPDPSLEQNPAGDGGLDLSTSGLSGPGAGAGVGMPAGGSMGPIGALASVQQSNGAVIGDGGVGGLANLMSSASAGGSQGMAPLLMSMVYPDLKPMLEASIRKVTVTVKWHEGRSKRTLDVQQYVTNPLQGGLDPNAAQQQLNQFNSLLPPGAKP